MGWRTSCHEETHAYSSPIFPAAGMQGIENCPSSPRPEDLGNRGLRRLRQGQEDDVPSVRGTSSLVELTGNGTLGQVWQSRSHRPKPKPDSQTVSNSKP